MFHSLQKKMNHPDAGMLLIRIGIAAVFLYASIGKLSDLPGTISFFASFGLPAFFVYLVAIVELVGSVAILLGVFTHIAGVILAIVMISAIIFVKSKMGFGMAEIDIMLLVSSLGIALAGPGKYALKLGKSCDNCDSCKGICTLHE